MSGLRAAHVFLYGVGNRIRFGAILMHASSVKVHIELRDVGNAFRELQRAVAFLSQRRPEYDAETEAVIGADAICLGAETHLEADTISTELIINRNDADIAEQITAILLIFPLRLSVGTDILSDGHDTISSHL